MKVNSLILQDFRNYGNLELDLDESRNIIVGENAQGKTNLVEAIYLTAFAKSFRTNNTGDLVRFGADSGRVSTYITSEGIEKNINIVLRRDGRKMISKDGKVIRRTTELLNNIVVIIFSPDDLRIIKDNPERRRSYINRELSQMRPGYYDVFRRYNDALKEKNVLLKNFAGSRQYSDDMLDIYDMQLADAGYEIIRYRKEFIEMLSREAAAIMSKISGGKEDLRIEYKTTCNYITGAGDDESDSMDGRELLYSQFRHNRDRDINSGYATLGPHRDDIDFYINDRNARKYGSQGQQRTIALSLKLAEIRIARTILDESPVLLMDDVLSELDIERQKFLISEIDDVQLFITSAEMNEEVIKYLRGGTLFRVEEGTITRVDKY